MPTTSWLVPPPFDQERDDVGAMVLREWATSIVQPEQHVLIVGAGAGAIGLPLARKGAKITFCDDNIVALQAAEQTFNQAQLKAQYCSTLQLPNNPTFDVALLNIIWWPNAARGQALLHLAASAVKPRGIVALAGGKDSGISTAERQLKTICGTSAPALYTKGHRVVAGRRPEQLPALNQPLTHKTIHVAGHPLQLVQQAGVFADNSLDPATAMLINTIDLPPTGRVLDLGCGAGILGMGLNLRQPNLEITYVDANVIAVAATEQNLQLNNLNGRVLASNGVEAVKNEQFDLVVTNPPFHLGRIKTQAIAEQFIHEARTVLADNGSFWLVANRFLRYEPTLEQVFGNVREAAGDTKFKVLHARVVNSKQ